MTEHACNFRAKKAETGGLLASYPNLPSKEDTMSVKTRRMVCPEVGALDCTCMCSCVHMPTQGCTHTKQASIGKYRVPGTDIFVQRLESLFFVCSLYVDTCSGSPQEPPT